MQPLSLYGNSRRVTVLTFFPNNIPAHCATIHSQFNPLRQHYMKLSSSLPSIPGILLIALFAGIATALSTLPFFQHLSLSPLIIGILIGMLFANTLGKFLPESWRSGLKFCSKRILRIGIIFFGFRLTLADVAQVGLSAVALDAIIVCSTLGLGILVGKWLKMDKETTLLTSSGSAICGAAAVLGAETTLKSEAYKTAVAVSTVVLFGTLLMFLYPLLYRNGFFPLSPREMGLYTGSTVHEVAHAVGASNAMGKEVADVAVIVKMIRVIMLVPVLLCFSWFARSSSKTSTSGQRKLVIPWFAILFLCAIALNTLLALTPAVTTPIQTIDNFALAMAMTALGCETTLDKFRQAGWRPFVLALVLCVWLVFGGFLVVKGLSWAGFIA